MFSVRVYNCKFQRFSVLFEENIGVESYSMKGVFIYGMCDEIKVPVIKTSVFWENLNDPLAHNVLWTLKFRMNERGLLGRPRDYSCFMGAYVQDVPEQFILKANVRINRCPSYTDDGDLVLNYPLDDDNTITYDCLSDVYITRANFKIMRALYTEEIKRDFSSEYVKDFIIHPLITYT